jgi:hypothetical protein
MFRNKIDAELTAWIARACAVVEWTGQKRNKKSVGNPNIRVRGAPNVRGTWITAASAKSELTATGRNSSPRAQCSHSDASAKKEPRYDFR